MEVTEVFLSHSSIDQPVPDRLAQTLRAHGIPVWISSKNILGAQQWQDEIGTALARCDWFAILLSKNSIRSMWAKRELSFALNEARFDGRIIPILLEPCDYRDLSWTLDLFEIIDFGSSVTDGCRALLRIWGHGFEPSKSAWPPDAPR